jgi:GT2 family glycosyltransferase
VNTRWHAAATRSTAPLVRVPTADAPVDVSFITVTYGTGPVVVDAVGSLVESMADDDLSYEIIVVDNEHPDATRRSRNELALSTAGVTVVSPGRNLGFAGGCELGALHATGRVLAFVNPDLVVGPGWLRPLLAELDRGASIVAPVFLDADGSIQEAGHVLYADGSTAPITAPRSLGGDDDRAPDYASAACWLIERTEHERLGGFDAAFHPAYYEDVEFALRAERLGHGVRVVPDVPVVHHRGMGTHGSSRTVDTSAQRDELLERVPQIRWTQPPRPDALR